MSDSWEGYESRPFCHHWRTPGDCEACVLESDVFQEVVTLLRYIAKAARETGEVDSRALADMYRKLPHSVRTFIEEA